MLRIAAKVKARRLELDLTQSGLAVHAAIPLSTYRRFERTGDISLQSLLNIAMVLDCLGDFATLFATRHYSSLDDMVKNNDKPRRRGKKNG